MNILGISAFYHDSAAALVVDGNIAAAAQEERFTRIKHDAGFPRNATDYCLREAGITPADIDYVVFYEKPLQKFDRLIETYLAFAPRGFASFSRAIPLWLKRKLKLRGDLRSGVGPGYAGPLAYVEHHEAHAASAFFPSPFPEAAVVTMDGVGEWATATIGHGKGREIRLLQEMRFPHSLGLLYSAFTYYCGFRVNSGEYKLMGLAPYGRPIYRDQILSQLIDLKDDGSLWMDMSFFNYCAGLTMTGRRFHRLFGREPRKPEEPIEQIHMDLAASIQGVTEEAMLRMCRHARQLTGSRNLCLAGGVALNCVGNGKILASGEFDGIWIQPAAGDAGGALGAALFAWHQLLENPRVPVAGDSQRGSLLGPRPSDAEVRAFLDAEGVPYHAFDDESELLDAIADRMAQQQVVGWFHGRMEFGPRALGARSIIGDARSETMQATMNLKIKYRESFRPFAPCVLREKAADYFELASESPYMLIVAPVNESIRERLPDDLRRTMDTDPDLRRRVNIRRSAVPAVTHVDYSARVQTVDAERHGRFQRLMRRFHEKTGCPVIINTSFNVRGEPIVCSPRDAFRCFMNTEMDVLVMEDCVLYKSEMPRRTDDERNRYRDSFSLD